MWSAEIRKPKTKRHRKGENGSCPSQPLPVVIENLTGLQATVDAWPCYHGVFTGHSVVVSHLEDARAIHTMGCFGKPSTNTFSPSGTKILRKRQYEQRQQWTSKKRSNLATGMQGVLRKSPSAMSISTDENSESGSDALTENQHFLDNASHMQCNASSNTSPESNLESRSWYSKEANISWGFSEDDKRRETIDENSKSSKNSKFKDVTIISDDDVSIISYEVDASLLEKSIPNKFQALNDRLLNPGTEVLVSDSPKKEWKNSYKASSMVTKSARQYESDDMDIEILSTSPIPSNSINTNQIDSMENLQNISQDIIEVTPPLSETLSQCVDDVSINTIQDHIKDKLSNAQHSGESIILGNEPKNLPQEVLCISEDKHCNEKENSTDNIETSNLLLISNTKECLAISSNNHLKYSLPPSNNASDEEEVLSTNILNKSGASILKSSMITKSMKCDSHSPSSKTETRQYVEDLEDELVGKTCCLASGRKDEEKPVVYSYPPRAKNLRKKLLENSSMDMENASLARKCVVISDSDCEGGKEVLIKKWNPQLMPEVFTSCDESLNLSLEETFFLSWALGCLQVTASHSLLTDLLTSSHSHTSVSNTDEPVDSILHSEVYRVPNMDSSNINEIPGPSRDMSAENIKSNLTAQELMKSNSNTQEELILASSNVCKESDTVTRSSNLSLDLMDYSTETESQSKENKSTESTSILSESEMSSKVNATYKEDCTLPNYREHLDITLTPQTSSLNLEKVIENTNYEEKSTLQVNDFTPKVQESPLSSKESSIIELNSATCDSSQGLFHVTLVKDEIDPKFLCENLQAEATSTKTVTDSVSLCENLDMPVSFLEQWSLFSYVQPSFPARYAAYHHLRAKGWVVRSGLKFGGDFLVYQQGPKFFHASYVARVVTEVTSRSWTQLLIANRIAEATGKEVLLCTVIWSEKSGCCLEGLKDAVVIERVVRRPKLSRERGFTEDSGEQANSQESSDESSE